MEYLIVANGYPSENDLYRNGFIHRRVKEYIKSEHNIFKVFVVTNRESTSYTYDGIQIIKGNSIELEKYLAKNTPSKLLIHFINKDMMNAIESAKYKNKIYIWVHGVEGLAWYRRLFNIRMLNFNKYIINNILHRKKLKKFIIRNKDNIKFIFVSEWMESIFKRDVYSGKVHKVVIPNIVDTELFKYKKKHRDLRKKILLIRPFSSKKYANDLAIDAILKLSKEEYFESLEFTIIGEGILFEKLTSKLKEFSNVKLINKFLSQKEISDMHDHHGIFLCPTRQDAQGVSMCEAMSSGLVPITSNSTAIPEFVINNSSGFLTNNSTEIAKCIKLLYNDVGLFENMSRQASSSIFEKCGPEETIVKELKLILHNE